MNDEFTQDLQDVLNKHSIDNECNTDDFILARYLKDCIAAFKHANDWRKELED